MEWISVQIINHRLVQARQSGSPNYNERPTGAVPELLVIHGISLPPGQFGGAHIEQLFENRLDPAEHPYFSTIFELRVSSHLLIRRDGEVIQFVGFDKRAWHAGLSDYQGRQNCNDFSIGIELEGTDDIPYEAVQYHSLAQAIKALLEAYPSLSVQHIVGHSDIAPGRKTDPGPAFDWDRLRQLLAAE